MSNGQINLSRFKVRFAFFWQAVRDGYRYLNIATHHTLGAMFKLLVAAYFIFCLLFLLLRYALLPNIDQYKGEVEAVATQAIGSPVTISTIQASWRGLRPHLSLDRVVIHDKDGKQALVLPNVSATVSWWSAIIMDVRLHRLEVNQPDMDIRRDANGNLYVAGIFIDTQKSGEGKGADWVLSQNQIVIRDGRLRWNDAKRGAPELALTGVNMVLRNRWRHHQFALKAIPPASFAAPLDVRADFEHPRLAKKVSDITRWKGELYVGLEQADLTVWKPFFNYPIDLQKGQGAVFAWLKFDHAKVVDFTADLTLADVATRLSKNALPLDLVRVNGRVSIREDVNGSVAEGTPTLGKQGHSISLADFSFTTKDGLIFPATTLSEMYTPAKKDQPEKTEITAKLLDLRTLAKFAEHLPLPAAQRQMLADYAPSGQLKDFSVQWRGTYPQITAYQVKGDFVGLGMHANGLHPTAAPSAGGSAAPSAPTGFENLTGNIDANEQGGAINLTSTNFKLLLPGYVTDPVMPIDQLKLRANWLLRDDEQIFWQVKQMDIAHEGLRASLWGTHLMPLKPHKAKSIGTLDLTGKIYDFDVKKLRQYLPLHTPDELRAWLVGGLQEGHLKDGALRIKGDLNHFPFHAAVPADKPKGEFSVSGKIERATLNYAPAYFNDVGSAPLWPQIAEINGTIAFDRSRLEIKAATATTSGVSLKKVHVLIPDLLADDAQLEIDGNAIGSLQNFVKFTTDSPVGNWIGHFADDTKATGNATLALKLRLPLDRLVDSTVRGTLTLDKNDIILQQGMPPMLQTKGSIEFSESGFNLPAIKASLLGLPVAVSGGTQRDGSIRVKADGGVSAEGLRKTYLSPAMQRLIQHVNGSARYSALITVKNHQPEIVIESSLQGLGLDFPVPMHKAANAAMPFKFELSGLPSGDASNRLDELKLSLGPTIAARYLRRKSMERGAVWHVLRGGLGVNVPAPEPDSGLIANVNLKSLNLDDWGDFVTRIVGDDKPAEGAEDGLNIAEYIEPDLMAARATELFILGKKLDNVVVGASHQKGLWQSNIDSDQVSGYVTWNESRSGRGLGKVTARLSSLIIPKSAASDVTDLLAGDETSTQIPGLDVIAENFELFGKKLGRLELAANNAFAFAAKEWRIKKLSISNPDGELNATGKWRIDKGGVNTSSLTYALEIADAGKLLDRLGFPDILRKGKGKMSGDVAWKGLPFSFDIPSLSGRIDLDLTNGQFLKVDPSAAKLLGVLSLQSLPRRLILDFRDVFSEGFAFDGVVAHADIARGILKTDSFKMRSVSATVLMDGTADLAKETTDLHVVLLPDVNAGAASALYGVLVNPVIGLGSFLAQLFFRAPLMKALTKEYQITGPWVDPVITQLEKKSDDPIKENSPAVSTSIVPGVSQ